MPIEIPYLVMTLGNYSMYRGRSNMELAGLAFIPMDPESYAELADFADTFRMVQRLYPEDENLAGLDMYTHATPVWKPESYSGSLEYGITHTRTPNLQPSLHYQQIENNADVYLRGEGARPDPVPLDRSDLDAWDRDTPIRFEVGPITHKELEREPARGEREGHQRQRLHPPAENFRASVNVSQGARGRLEFVWSLPYGSSMKTNAVSYNVIEREFGPAPPSFRAFERMM